MILDLAGAELRRSPDDVDLSDLTTASRTGEPVWLEDGTLDIPFDRPLSADEQALIRRRLLTADATEESWVAQARAVVADLAGQTTPVARGVRLLLVKALREVKE